MQKSLRKRLLDVATAPYRSAGRSDYYWARGKLSRDPIFTALLERGVFPDGARVLDLGCGRGLLAAWLLAAEQMAAQGSWDAPQAPPKALRFRGVELVAREAHCGNAALQPLYGDRVALSGGDMRSAGMEAIDAVAILDVLHYIPHAEQDQLLDRIRAALGPGGLFLTRVGDASGGWRFRISQWVDRRMAQLQGHRYAPTWCRPLAEWRRTLERRGFTVEALPMSSGTPFANVMLICRVK
ncbi:MAG: SAM-dependent methyltransferase [Pseudomonadota bacterium]|nr:SAM-dependent methyltransferase [Pseudomonadota bacterium]